MGAINRNMAPVTIGPTLNFSKEIIEQNSIGSNHYLSTLISVQNDNVTIQLIVQHPYNTQQHGITGEISY